MSKARYLGPKGCRIELVEWVDSNSRAGWHSLTEAKDKSETDVDLCVSAGFLIHETKTHVLLALSAFQQAHGDDVCSTMQIPKAAILRRTRIRSAPRL